MSQMQDLVYKPMLQNGHHTAFPWLWVSCKGLIRQVDGTVTCGKVGGQRRLFVQNIYCFQDFLTYIMEGAILLLLLRIIIYYNVLLLLYN